MVQGIILSWWSVGIYHSIKSLLIEVLFDPKCLLE